MNKSLKKYKYRPPFKYLFIGIGGIVMSIIFALAIGKDNIWFSLVMALFCLMTFIMGIGFLIIFIRKFDIGNLIIGKDFIEIPGRWKKRIRFQFEEIIEVGEFDTYDNVIEIETKKGFYQIEKEWMDSQDFKNFKETFQSYWLKS